jgi:hypothetical protein
MSKPRGSKSCCHSLGSLIEILEIRLALSKYQARTRRGCVGLGKIGERVWWREEQ